MSLPRLFQCPFTWTDTNLVVQRCEQAFAKQHNVDVHTAAYHALAIDPSTGQRIQRRFICSLCAAQINDLSSIRKHILTCHAKLDAQLIKSGKEPGKVIRNPLYVEGHNHSSNQSINHSHIDTESEVEEEHRKMKSTNDKSAGSASVAKHATSSTDQSSTSQASTNQFSISQSSANQSSSAEQTTAVGVDMSDSESHVMSVGGSLKKHQLARSLLLGTSDESSPESDLKRRRVADADDFKVSKQPVNMSTDDATASALKRCAELEAELLSAKQENAKLKEAIRSAMLLVKQF
jgi:hypothetical protein